MFKTHKIILVILFFAFQHVWSKIPQTIFFDKITSKTCSDSVIVLNANASSGLEVQFSLFFGNAILESNRLTILGIGTIILNITQEGDAQFEPASNIINSFEVTDSWHNSQNPSSVFFKSNYCDSEPIIMTATNNNKLKYIWKTADNQTFNNSKLERPAFSSSVSGLYTISVSQGFCSVFSYEFQVNILTTTGFSIEEPPTQILDDAKPFELKASLPEVRIWVENKETNLLLPADLELGKRTITYKNINSDNNCARTIKREITIIENTEITVYELVTPNIETNTYFYIQNITKNPMNQVAVFSKSGQKIFETSNYRNDWSPKELASGSYFYRIVLPEKNKEYTGLIYISN